MMTPCRGIALGVFAGGLLMAVAGYLFRPRFVKSQVDYKMPGNPGPKIVAAQAAAIERRERLIDQTVWLKDMEAQKCGRVFEDFWDALNCGREQMRRAVAERQFFEICERYLSHDDPQIGG